MVLLSAVTIVVRGSDITIVPLLSGTNSNVLELGVKFVFSGSSLDTTVFLASEVKMLSLLDASKGLFLDSDI